MAKKVPVTIAIDADLLADVDDVAERMGLSRSAYISLLITGIHADPSDFLTVAIKAAMQSPAKAGQDNLPDGAVMA